MPGTADALAEQPHERLGDGDHRGDPLGAVRRVRVPVEVTQALAHPGVDLRAGPAQQRLREPAEHHAAGKVAHRRVTHLGGGHEMLQRQAGLLAQ